jgi:murein DD-endopeptidase MepM/ murein hydrolase activator NlpD
VGNKSYTFMIVPHAAAKFRRFRVSRNLVFLGGGLIGLLVIAGLVLPHFLIKTWRLGIALEHTRQENAELRQSNEKFDASLADLRGKLSEIEAKAAKFALMVGVEDVAVPQLPAGGSSFDMTGLAPQDYETALEGEMGTLMKRSGTLEDSFRILDTAFQKQALLLSSTPSIFPVRGLLGNGYGWRRDPFTGMRDFHQGLDIIAPLGTNVVAPAEGIVTRVGKAGGFGKSIFLSHGNAIVTRYAHLSSAKVRVGQRVKRGDVIATIGSTGRSTGPHLHYEVMVHQKNVDPVKYIIEEFRTF